MKKHLKPIALIISFVLVFTLFVPSFATDGKVFIITSPYDNVDFSSVKQYKTALHTHTNASDGGITLFDSIERHVQAGFDIIAVTDHGTVDYGWKNAKPNYFIHGALSLLGRSKGELRYLGQSGEFSDGIGYNNVTKENGDDYLELSDGREILRIPYGIENNAVSVNAHVNSWFVDYHDNTVTEYIDAVSGVDAKDGVCVINHPGEYTKARYELHSCNAYDPNDPAYAYFINKFASLIDDYDACIGIDINSKGDSRTRYDRILWDELLKRFSKNGENVYAIASSDAHAASVIDTGFVYLLMDEKTSSQARYAIENAMMFPASHCIGNYDEIVEFAQAIKEFYGENELYNKLSDTALQMENRIFDIEHGDEKADSSINIVYSVLDENGYCTAKNQPMITDIKTDGDVITISTQNAAVVRFISNGRTVCIKKADEAQIKLSDYADFIGDYVRAEVFGEGGVVYTEAFLINANEKSEKHPVADLNFKDLGILDFLLAEFKNWFNIISISIKKVF